MFQEVIAPYEIVIISLYLVSEHASVFSRIYREVLIVPFFCSVLLVAATPFRKQKMGVWLSGCLGDSGQNKLTLSSMHEAVNGVP